jgi:hypothetical protein
MKGDWKSQINIRQMEDWEKTMKSNEPESLDEYLDEIQKSVESGTCRVGITTDIVGRRAKWKTAYPRMRNWKILEEHSSKADAQEARERLAGNYKCEAHKGGDDPDDPNARWVVYYFEYE